MAYQFTLNDQEYAALAAEAEKNGTEPEQLLHETIQRLYISPQSPPPTTLREFAEMLYRKRQLTHLPTKQSIA